MRYLLITLLLWQQLAAGQTPGETTAGTSGTSKELEHIAEDRTEPSTQKASVPSRTSFFDVLAPYRRPTAPALQLGPADRARSLVRNGVVYLSLFDAIALSIENNLDVEVARYGLSLAGADRLRASGGGSTRPELNRASR